MLPNFLPTPGVFMFPRHRFQHLDTICEDVVWDDEWLIIWRSSWPEQGGGLLAKPTRLVFQKWNVSGREIPPRYQIQFLDSPARLPTGKVFNTISGSNSEITEPGMANARLSGQNMQLWCDLEDSSCSLLFFLTLPNGIFHISVKEAANSDTL